MPLEKGLSSQKGLLRSGLISKFFAISPSHHSIIFSGENFGLQNKISEHSELQFL